MMNLDVGCLAFDRDRVCSMYPGPLQGTKECTLGEQGILCRYGND